MIRVLEDINNKPFNIELKENDDKNLYTDKSMETEVNDCLGITLAGLNDNIYFNNVDMSEYPYVTVEYYVKDQDDDTYDDIYLGTWDFDFDEINAMSEIDKVKYLDNISSEVDAAASDYISESEND